MKFPVNSLLAGNFGFRDGFAADQRRVRELSVPACSGSTLLLPDNGQGFIAKHPKRIARAWNFRRRGLGSVG
jgi:hypothetical protein